MNDSLTFSDGSVMNRSTIEDWCDYALLQLGYTDWRGSQKESLVNLLLGCNVFALMPTGTGKSAVYQCAAKLAELTAQSCRFFRPLILVVSPLKSLQADQVRSCEALGIPVACLNGDMGIQDQRMILDNLDKYRILFVAPEQLRNQDRWDRLEPRVALWVIDEAHCVSSWGHDFRPAYAKIGKRIGETTESARGGFHAPVLCLTATATEETIQNTIQTLGLPSMQSGKTVVFSDRPLRSNISLEVRRIPGGNAKMIQAHQANAVIELASEHQQTIVYCQSQAEVDRLTSADGPFWHTFGSSVVGFHADTPLHQRLEAMDSMHAGRARLGVFTCAAGMGIDWGKVDCVVHSRPPGRLEAMVQEAGRAGRSGQEADHVMLWDPRSFEIPLAQLESNNPGLEEYRKAWGFLMGQKEDLMLVSQRKIGELCGVSEYTIPTVIGQIREWGLINLKDQKQGQQSFDKDGKKIHHATKWLEIKERIPFDSLPLSEKVLEEKKRRDKRGLNAIMGYCAQGICRGNTIDQYFRPSAADKRWRCEKCDLCNIPF